MKRIFIIVFALLSTSIARADEGMWLLSMLGKNIATMQEMGCKLSAEDIYSINQACLKDAVVGLGRDGRPFSHFCSGEIISAEGLVLTNHHCGFPYIQAHSTVEHDYLANGFWAYDKKDELANPGLTASILQRIEDVTDRVNAALNDKMTEEERALAIQAVAGEITREATRGTNLAAQVQSMFEGNQFCLLVYKIYRDVRLVGAPPQSMGKFGGDTDNWIWPRHTCDFSMFRIYTGPDGEPAPFSEKNIPLKPKHFFPVSAKGIQDGDFAMMMGFPGTTDRFLTSYGLKVTMEGNDIRYKVRSEKLRIMKEGMDKDPQVRIQYASKHASCANYWKNAFEQNKALKKLNTMGAKEAIERDFMAWVNADAGRKAKYGEALNLIRDGYAQLSGLANVEMYTLEALLQGGEAYMFAMQTGPAFMMLDTLPADKREMVTENLRNAAKSFYKDFNEEIDVKTTAALLQMYAENVAPEMYPEIITEIMNKYKGDFTKFAETMGNKSIYRNEAAFMAFLEKPDVKKLEKDLAYRTGTSIFQFYRQLEQDMAATRSSIAKGDRLFVNGLMTKDPDKAWAPNANSTLRLTYGKVGSYKPRDAVFYDYYTTLTGVMEKEGPKGGEFEVPDKLKEVYKAKDFSPYGTNNIVTCFITNNDITGGTSGSPVINGNGELIGTAFDGNSEAMSGDIDFEENLQRCINLDARYMLFVVDKIAGAKNLIREMKIVY